MNVLIESDNMVQAYLIAFGVIVIGLLLLRIFKRILLNRLEKWILQRETRFDDMIVRGIERFGLPIISFAVI